MSDQATVFSAPPTLGSVANGLAPPLASPPASGEAARTFATPLLPQNIDLAAGPERFRVAHAHGAHLFDETGQAYLDLCMGYGALVLGHGAATIKDALHQQLDRSWMYGFAHGLQEPLAALIQAAGPANELVSLCNSESDATLLALRAARAFTERERIAVFADARHGLYDFALITEAGQSAKAANDTPIRRRAHIGAGIPAFVDAYVTVLPYGDAAAIDWLRLNGSQLAAVIAEPFSSKAPSLGHGPWLRQIRDMCRDAGAMFILDEALSGFRLAYGGAQELFGLSPDLLTYGNALGGGLSIGAVAGRADVMASFGQSERNKRIFSGTTHSGNPLSVAAAHAVLSVLLTHRDTVYPQLNISAAEIAAAFNDVATSLGVNVTMACAGSMFRVIFAEPGLEAIERAFYQHVLNRKVVVHASKRCFLSTAHTVADIQEISAAFGDSLRDAVGASGNASG